MDGGFRKLWSRKKSFGSADHSAHQRKLSSGNGTSLQTPSTASGTRDGRPSMASSHLSERPYSRDKFGGSIKSGDDYPRTKSGHRIQPMLVGISRPEIGKDRPGTAGSLQTAVQKAADSVGHRPQDVQPTHSTPPRPIPNNKLTPRYVDVFAVAASVPTYSSKYNEDIAERNLDTYRLVLENTPYVYNPSSKYQEEVATRNAYLPYRSRPSTDTLRRSMDQDRSASAANKSIRNQVSPLQNSLHVHQSSLESAVSNQSSIQEYAAQHYRQLSGRSRDGNQLPAIPQEHIEADRSSRQDNYNSLTQYPYSPPRSNIANGVPRETRMHTITEGQSDVNQASSSQLQRISGQSNTFSDYKVSAAEYSRPNTHRSMRSDRDDTVFGPPISRSTASSIRRAIVLPNRTIMDLTDEPEVTSEASSAFGYSQYSPVVEQAKFDAFRRIQPSQIHSEERHSSREATQSDEPPRPAFMNSIHILADDDATPVESYTSLENRSPVSAAPAAPVPISFSPISTVASWSPRSSAYIPTSTEPISMTARVAAALEAGRVATRDSYASSSGRSVSTDNRSSTVSSFSARDNHVLPTVNTVIDDKLSTMERPSSFRGGETPTVRERVATFENTRERSTSPSTSTTIANPNGVSVKMLANSQPPPDKIPQQAASKETTSTPVSKAPAAAPYTPSIYTSPDSITSVDYTNPGTTFGVRTRDFAVSPIEDKSSGKGDITPKASQQFRSTVSATKTESQSKTTKASTSRANATKSSTTKLVATKPTPSGKSTKVRTKQNTPSQPPPSDTGFDEEAFSRKQAEARAALEKLQRSLSEDFLTLPDRATIKSAKGKEPATENRVSAPALVLPETKAVASSTSKAESEKAPPSSFRPARGEQQRSSLVSNRSISAGSRSSRRAPVPSSLRNVEPATNPIDQNLLSPALLQALQISSKAPKSPGEISLSSFPVPSSSRPPSQPDAPLAYASLPNSFVGVMKRRSSTKSQGSVGSTFSIPYHMVPGRSSSVRDPVPEEGDII